MNTLHTSRVLRGLVVVALAAAAPWALAHSGAGLGEHSHTGLADGLAHPFVGLDHLLALLAVGAWSAVAMRPAWLAPAAFLAMLGLGVLVGALVDFAGVQPPGVEPMLAASLLVVGLLLARRQVLSARGVWALVGGFAVFHGLAHGIELSAALGPDAHWSALAGLIASSAALLVLGSLLGQRLASRAWLQRAGGGAVALFGGGLLLALMR